MSVLYHISRAGQVIGQFTLDDLEKAIRLGSVRTTDHCWMEGMTDWAPVAAVLGLAAAPGASPPPMRAAPATAPGGFVDASMSICSRCGHVGAAGTFRDSGLIPRGSASYWVALVICFPISVLYYLHVEQQYKKSSCCTGCGADALVPVSTPMGKDLQRRLGS